MLSPTVFAYVLLFTLLLAVAAAAMDWAVQGRAISRHFWTAAIVLGVLAPPLVFAWHALQHRNSEHIATGAPAELGTIIVWSGRPIAYAVRNLMSDQALHRFMGAALVIWGFFSATLITWLIVGVAHWRRAQREWRRTTLDGVEVDVSPFTGPAVLGLRSHRIVVPEWATTMGAEHRHMILAHECEHIRSRDPERLALGIAAIVLVPWNIALWWCAARLRRAIELDCDARVLRRFPNAREYGYVLLEVAARGRNAGPLAVPMVGLLRLPSELERRLRAMTKTRRVGVRSAVTGGIGALLAISAAFTTPVPSLRFKDSPTLVRQANMTMLQGITIGDTIPSSGIKRDSLRVVSEELAVRERELARTRASLDSATVALALQKEQLRTSAMGFQLPKNRTYVEFRVDKPAAALPGGPYPYYPDSLRKAGVEGEVRASFVVDTAGHVDPASIRITKATNPLFAEAVRTAIPHMRFSPAEIHGRHIRQLIQQPFTFSISH